MEKGVAPAIVGRAKRFNCQVTTKVVIYGRVVWAVDSFVQYEIPGMDGIFPAHLLEREEVLVRHSVRIFRACLATNYGLVVWL
jgi:hypothetical protein